MTTLSASKIVTIWEAGAARHPIERALIAAGAAEPSLDWNTLGTLSLGRINMLLLQLWRDQFGPVLPCLVRCPKCLAELEFELAPDSLLDHARLTLGSLPSGGASQATTSFEAFVEGRSVQLRPVESRNLVAAIGLDPKSARRYLMERCLVSEPLDVFDDDAVEVIEDAVLTNDPLAEIRISLDCVDCGQTWSSTVDMGSLVWKRLSVLARSVFATVDILAKSYGWSESAILAMSEVRRNHYLELAQS